MPAAKGAIQHIPVTRVTSDAHAHSHYQASLKAGYEGQIIQTPDGSVQKRKPVQDSEYTVVGAAKGKKHGILTMRDGAGKTFRVQAPAHLAHEAQVGKQATVGYTRLTSSGVPHAPVFKAVRDYELSVREFACNLMKKPNVLLKKRPPIARNSMREVGQAMGGPTATFQRKGQLREFAARLRMLMFKCTKKTPLKKLVEFNTFRATRNLLQELKSAGVAVSRKAGETSFFSGPRNLINIPRGEAGVAEGIGRRNALFHEAGHAKVNAAGEMDKFHIEAHNADQAGASFADRFKIGSHGNEMRRQERLANQTAQADMQRMGVPKENIAYFRKDMAGALNTYRAGHYSTVSQKATFPASSPKVTTTQATAAAPTAQPSQPSQSSQAPQPPQSPQAPQPPQSPQPQPTSPFRKRRWVAGGVAAAGAVGVAGYMANARQTEKEFGIFGFGNSK